MRVHGRRLAPIVAGVVILFIVSGLASCSRFTPPHVAQGPGRAPIPIDTAQVPTWSREEC